MDAYKIGIHIALSSNVAQAMAAIGAHFVGMQSQIKEIEKNWDNVKSAIGGVIAVMTGEKMLGAIGTLIEKTKDLSHEWVQLEKTGMGTAAVEGIKTKAQALAHEIPGTTQLGLEQYAGTAYSIFGAEHAKELMGPMAQFGQAIGNTTGKFDFGAQDMMKMLRAGELVGAFTDKQTGQVDVASAQKFFEIGAKVMLGTHGIVTPQTWLGLAQQGGAAALRQLDEKGLYSMGIYAQAMGGPRAGTAYMSLMQQLAGGTMWRETAKQMQALGLMGEKDWSYSQGKVHLTDDIAKKLTAKMNDPLALIQEYIDAMEKHGITDKQAQMRKLYQLFQRQTVQRFTSEGIANLQQMLSERERIMGALGMPAALQLQNTKDLAQDLNNVSKAWTNLLQSIGGPSSQMFANWANSLRGAIDAVSRAVEAHPDITKIATTLFAGVGIAAIVAGVAAVITAAAPFVGAVGALTAVAAAFTAMAALNWSSIASGLESLTKGFESLIDKIQKTPGGAAPSQPGSVDEYGRPNELPGKQGFNSIPPGKEGGGQSVATVNLSGRAVGDIVLRYINDSLDKPDEGSTYPDSVGAGVSQGIRKFA